MQKKTEMREKGIRNIGMDRQGRLEKRNKTFGTERCENIGTLYINILHTHMQHGCAAWDEN